MNIEFITVEIRNNKTGDTRHRHDWVEKTEDGPNPFTWEEGCLSYDRSRHKCWIFNKPGEQNDGLPDYSERLYSVNLYDFHENCFYREFDEKKGLTNESI